MRTLALLILIALSAYPADWQGAIRTPDGKPVGGARIRVRSATADSTDERTSAPDGTFRFENISPGEYTVHVLDVPPVSLRIDAATAALRTQLVLAPDSLQLGEGAGGVGGEQLDSRTVSGVPLNKRDFSQLLLLASGTMTDSNGAANFTQQFAINGQRGTATVFAMDGVYTSDPELGGATFSNFNVDAIQETASQSGVMPAEVGQGAAGFTNVVTKSGSNEVHGSLFWFVRNAVLDARNFFDRQSIAQPKRLPPFQRNEFGLTNGGPVVIPRVYDGRNRTYYFAQYQGFRQVLGTTQVLPVPTAAERRGLNTTAVPGDTLFVPIDSEIARVLALYPLPNDPQGAFGPRTYAASSKVTTFSDQFSARLDHSINDRHKLFVRFTQNNVDGPLINPSQIAIDPSFATTFFDRQTNAAITHTWTPSPNTTVESSLSFLRSTPNFQSQNTTLPGVHFNDGLFEPINGAAGSVYGAFGNLLQLRQVWSRTAGRHAFKWGGEVRTNRDSTVFGINPNGDYTFGGGVSPSPVAIRSASGAHDIQPGDILPDSLSAFLTGSAFTYNSAQAPAMFAQGDRIGLSAVRREMYNLFWQDQWRASDRLTISYGIRYELNSQIREHKKRESGLLFDQPAYVNQIGAVAPLPKYVVHPRPQYDLFKGGFSPRLSLEYKAGAHTVFRAGASVSHLLTNLWQENMLTGGTPIVIYTYRASSPTDAVRFSSNVIQLPLPQIYMPSGALLYPNNDSTEVAPNSEMDTQRFIRDLAALSPDRQVRPLNGFDISSNFRTGYVPSWTAGLERKFGDVQVAASYVGTAGVRLPAIGYPNGYPGAGPEYSPYSRFDSQGRPSGGYGLMYMMDNHSHSSYHSLQMSASKSTPSLGLSFVGSYTFSRSIDDTSAVLGGFISTGSGALLQSSAQDPKNWRAEKGPSTFDVQHVATLSAFQDLPIQRLPALRSLPRAWTTGWQVMNVTTLMTGSPFNVFSGIQQTAAGFNSADRPDLAQRPDFSTSRSVREDYFGRGAANASYFFVPVNLPGGSGPNNGRFGTLGRNPLRGPGLKNFDFALIKDTLLGRRGNAELMTLQFRAEFFNALNLVNFGLPSNIVLGTGFGVINKTSTTSRQIQFSLKLLY